jgi:hypothetical protein
MPCLLYIGYRYRNNVLKQGIHYLEVPYVEWSQWDNVTLSERVTFLPANESLSERDSFLPANDSVSETESFIPDNGILSERVPFNGHLSERVPFSPANDTLSERISFLPPASEGRGGYRGPLIVLTERGYLRLIMYFEDELSKTIWEYVLDTDFKARDERRVERLVEAGLGKMTQSLIAAGQNLKVSAQTSITVGNIAQGLAEGLIVLDQISRLAGGRPLRSAPWRDAWWSRPP